MGNGRFTILAQVGGYGVLGSPDGESLIPAAAWAINSLRKHLVQPVHLPAPPEDAPRSGEYKMQVVPELPPDAILFPKYRTEMLTGITVYCCFYAGAWYLREIRGTGGKYYRVETGGAVAREQRAEAVRLGEVDE